jgi:hypothetical protein
MLYRRVTDLIHSLSFQMNALLILLILTLWMIS